MMTHTNITVNGVEYTPVIKQDKWKDLKQAFAEGAIIECNLEGEDDWLIKIPSWLNNYNYRIKDNISIASWNKHKDVIKQFWNGAKVEFTYNGGFPQTVDSNIAWSTDCEYRVKQDKWKLPEYGDGSRWAVSDNLQIGEWTAEYYTKAGRRRTTKELAKRCAKASKERDLLEAYRDHLEPDYVDPDWDDANTNKYYIYTHKGKYAVEYNFNAKDLGKVYGSQKTMTQICAKLNDGTISLK